MQALEEMGAEVLVLSADVGDMEQMREAVRRTEERFGRVDGVIHAAGVPGAGLIQLKTEEVAASVLRPKVQGTLVLDEVFKDRPPDFLLLFSSMTSIVGGGPGQLDYCAANAFLDAFAQKNNSRHRPVFAINWGEWQWDAWQEGLLGFDAKIAAVFKENRRRFGVSFEEGLDAIRRVLATKLPQVVVSTRDFKWLIELSKEFTVSGILSEADKKCVRPGLSKTITRNFLCGSEHRGRTHDRRDLARVAENRTGGHQRQLLRAGRQFAARHHSGRADEEEVESGNAYVRSLRSSDRERNGEVHKQGQ